MGTIFLILGLAFLLSVLPVGFLLLRAYLKARGPRVIVCPETRTSEAVAVDPARAAWAAVRQERDYRLLSCTRWPGRQDCGQDCLAEIEAAPDGCLVRERLARWYEGAICAICHKPFEQIEFFSHKPALVTPDRRVLRWEDIAPKDLPVVLGAHCPLCWDCQVAETFRARFPDLVIDDPRPPVSGRRTGSAA